MEASTEGVRATSRWDPRTRNGYGHYTDHKPRNESEAAIRSYAESNDRISRLVNTERDLYQRLLELGSGSLVGQLVIRVVGFFPTGTSAVEETRYYSSDLLTSLSSIVDDPKLLQTIHLVKCARRKAVEENSKLM